MTKEINRTWSQYNAAHIIPKFTLFFLSNSLLHALVDVFIVSSYLLYENCFSLGGVRLQLQIESRGFRTELIWSLNLIWRCLFGQSGDFLIWSSSGSATASNSHALPYIVVELELLASDQSGALLVRPSNCPPMHYAPTATALTDDGITAAAAGPIQCPLFNFYCRHSDPTGQKTSLILILIQGLFIRMINRTVGFISD